MFATIRITVGLSAGIAELVIWPPGTAGAAGEDVQANL